MLLRDFNKYEPIVNSNAILIENVAALYAGVFLETVLCIGQSLTV